MARAPRPRDPRKIAKRIHSITDIDPFLRVLVFGRNGKGKTRFAATAPNVLIIDINERGTKSARKDNPTAKVYPVEQWSDIGDIYWYLAAGNHKFESVAVDTLTAMQVLCMRHVLKEAHEFDPNKDPNTPTKRDYLKVSELMKPTLLAFRNLPMHVIFTAQERTFGDPEEGEAIEVVPNLSGANRDVATGAVDIIGRIYMKEVRKKVRGKTRSKWETRMLVGPHDEITTKDRENVLGRVVLNPTVPKMLAAYGITSNDDEEE